MKDIPTMQVYNTSFEDGYVLFNINGGFIQRHSIDFQEHLDELVLEKLRELSIDYELLDRTRIFKQNTPMGMFFSYKTPIRKRTIEEKESIEYVSQMNHLIKNVLE